MLFNVFRLNKKACEKEYQQQFWISNKYISQKEKKERRRKNRRIHEKNKNKFKTRSVTCLGT